MKKINEFLETARAYLSFFGKWVWIIVLWLMFVASFTNNDKDVPLFWKTLCRRL